MNAVADGCTHQGQALWSSHWEAWCSECGVTIRYPELISAVRAHAQGDIWNETA